MIGRPVREPFVVVVAALAVSASATVALIAGAGLLTVELPGRLPLGNVLAALVFCGIAAAAVAMSPRRGRARRVAVAALAASIAWLPLSIALAGNVALNFSGDRGTTWVLSSIALLVFALGALAFATFARWRTRRGASTGLP